MLSCVLYYCTVHRIIIYSYPYGSWRTVDILGPSTAPGTAKLHPSSCTNSKQTLHVLVVPTEHLIFHVSWRLFLWHTLQRKSPTKEKRYRQANGGKTPCSTGTYGLRSEPPLGLPTAPCQSFDPFFPYVEPSCMDTGIKLSVLMLDFSVVSLPWCVRFLLYYCSRATTVSVVLLLYVVLSHCRTVLIVVVRRPDAVR